jgi:hypothetical protein
MALNSQLSNNTVNVGATAEAALFNGGFVDMYDGAQPATADTAISTQVKGVRCTLNATAFGAPTNGVLTANAITSGTATAGITPTWARILKSDGVTVIMDCTVGTSSTNIILAAASFAIGTTVGITSFTHTVAKSASGL